MKEYGLIYAATYKDGRVYVGQTVGSTRSDLMRRKSCHLSEARNGKDTAFYRAIRKYGSESFIWSILEIVPIDNLNSAEVRWIEELNSYHDGFNSTLGGDGVKGLKFTQEQLKYRNKPEVKKRHLKSMNRLKQQSGFREKKAKTLAKTRESIIYQINQLTGITSLEAREKMRRKGIERWSNPDYRRKQIESIRRACSKKK